MPGEIMIAVGMGPVLLELFAPRLISFLPVSVSALFPAADGCVSVLDGASAAMASSGDLITMAVICLVFGFFVLETALHDTVRAWWDNPKNKAETMRRFQESVRTGKPSWVYATEHGPFHLSECIGNTATGSAAIFYAQAYPVLVIYSVVFFALHALLPGAGGLLTMRAFRAICGPLGLWMVSSTPYKTLVEDPALYELRRVPSEVEARYIASWKTVHVRGFIRGIVVPILLELGAAVTALVGVYQTDPLPVGWPLPAYYAYVALSALGALSACTSLHSFVGRMVPLFEKTPEQAPARNYQLVANEMNVLMLMGLATLCNAAALLFVPGAFPAPSPGALVVRGALALLVVRAVLKRIALDGFAFSGLDFCGLPSYLHMTFFARSSACSKCPKGVGAKYLAQFRATHQGVLTRALEKRAARPIYFLRVVQAGRPDPNDDLIIDPSGDGVCAAPNAATALGGCHPPCRQLLVRPEHYAHVLALELHQLATHDLAAFGADLAALLRALPSADTLHLPYGSRLKHDRKTPFVRLSLGDYAADLRALSPSTRPNSAPLAPAEDEVAFDVTEKLLCPNSLIDVPSLAPLRKGSLVAFLEGAEPEALLGFFTACGTIVPQAMQQPPTDLAKMHQMLWDDTVASYELQVRGVNAPTPTFVLRMPKADVKLLKEGWAKKPVAAALPACLA